MDAEEQILQLLKSRPTNVKSLSSATTTRRVLPGSAGLTTTTLAGTIPSIPSMMAGATQMASTTTTTTATTTTAAAASSAPRFMAPPSSAALSGIANLLMANDEAKTEDSALLLLNRRHIWSEIERHAANVNELIAKAKFRAFSPSAEAESDLYNSASCLLKSVHSLQPSSINHGMATATATGLHANVRAVPAEVDNRRRKAALISSAEDGGGGGGSAAPRRKKVQAPVSGQACAQCHRTDSPEWRKGPDGQHSLCNACGLRFARQQAKQQKPEQ
jgi:hypothetical protein